MAEPDTKKRKIESLTTVHYDNQKYNMDALNDTEKIEKVIDDMKNSKSNLKPVLADEVMEDLPTVNVYVATVLDKKSIFKVIVALNSLFPLENLQHLKRARSTEILICLSDGVSPADVISSLKEKDFHFEMLCKEDLKIVAVAKIQPLVKWQYEKAHAIWPCNFHPNKYMEKLISGNFFSPSEVEKHRKYMALAYEIAEIYEGLRNPQECKTVEGLDRSDEKVFYPIDAESMKLNVETLRQELTDLKGVVVVDPSIDSIVAVGFDRRNSNPCQHPIMIAIDNVARTQRGGAWKDDSMFEQEIQDDSQKMALDGVPKMFRNILNTSYDNLKFGAKISTNKERNSPETGEKNAAIDAGLDTILDSASSNTDSLANLDDASSKPSGPYLCTGYDVYTTNEPCVMCSMALVHSRAKMVMFALKNKANGALESISKLHAIPALNHHYEVFTGFFEELLSL